MSREGYSVMYLTQQPIEQLPLAIPNVGANADRDAFRNIIFRYCKSLSTLVQTLLELHIWSLCPRILILDSLHTYFAIPSPDFGENPLTHKEFAENHALVIASIQNAVDSLMTKTRVKCFSIVTTDFIGSPNYDQFKQLLVDLYYNQPGSIVDNCRISNILHEIHGIINAEKWEKITATKIGQ